MTIVYTNQISTWEANPEMEITINTLLLEVAEKTVPFTLKMAKSLPIFSASDRIEDYFTPQGKLPAICKVPRKQIIPDSFEQSVLLLVKHPTYGLCWQSPVYYDANFPDVADDLESVPSVILL
jgi:hypothetical protein